MFNFKKIGKKVLSSVLGATLAMGGFLNTQIVKVNGYNYNEDKYWDPFTMLSNAKFILGDNKQENIEELEEKLNKTIGEGKDEDKTNFEKEIVELLSENEDEKEIYNAVKQFITCKEANFKEKVNFKELENTNTGKRYIDNVSYQIVGFEENGNKKAIVFIVVKNNCILAKNYMKYVKQDLASYEYSTTNDGDFYNCKNVNFIIRPENRSEKFGIGEKAISGCTGATINAQGANINAENAIESCSRATINAQEATIKDGRAINKCEKSTINLQRANIYAKYAINECEEATINAQVVNINAHFAINRCEKSTINLQGATISQGWAIDNCKKSTINLQGANINAENVISYCDEATIYYDKSTEVLTEGKALLDCLTWGGVGVNLINLNDNDYSESSDDDDYSNPHDYKEGKKSFLKPLIVGGGILAALAACLISIPVIGPIIEQHIKNRKTKVNIKKTNTNINTHTNK